MKDIDKIIGGLKKKFIENDLEYENVFEGPQFPQANEIDSIITLCSIIKEKYKCVDPLDKSNQRFKDREILCNSVVDLIK